MAVYRVGMRIRYVRTVDGTPPKIVPLGEEGTILGIYEHHRHGFGYEFSLDNHRSDHPTGNFFGTAYMLAPLLPPDDAADAFMARLKKLGSEPVNDAPKVTVEAK